ncbi:O-antigen ligase family protein [Lysobacter sp. H21R4]|uniref:O-antigen ligase family protein n=1 Tax=Lysobacter sp. H21R4 TaxID=2781021 RepID=UPI00188820BE|nr:O-antigen ligase family protein [Lysobacter sp. H21R4]QOY62010.1 O-antigen ligase family protein [Lysobacter sp. H21R4]
MHLMINRNHLFAFAIIIFVATQGVLISQFLFLGESTGDSEGTPIAQLFWAAVSVLQLTIGGMFFAKHFQSVKSRGKEVNCNVKRLVAWGLALVAFCLISTIWSVNGEVTLRRTYSLGANLLFGISVFAVLGRERWIQSVFFACAIPVIASLLFYVLGADWARMENAYVGAARGVYAQKNVLGMYAWVALLFTIYMRRSGSISFRFAFLAVASSALSITFSQSITAMLSSVVALLSYFLVLTVSRMSAPIRVVTVLVAAMFGLAIVLITITGGGIDSILGRDVTLTGRTEIWSYLQRAIADRPILGYGFAAFWRTDEYASFYVSRLFGYAVSHSHNGFLDLALDLGLLYASLICGAIILALGSVVRALLLLRLDGVDAVFIALFLGLLLTSLSEPVFLIHNSFVTILFWVSFAYVFNLKGRYSR